MATNNNKEGRAVGGIRGFFTRAYHSVETLGTQGGAMALSTSLWAAKTAGTWGFYMATTAMVVFVPLMFEIGRERQVRNATHAIMTFVFWLWLCSCE